LVLQYYQEEKGAKIEHRRAMAERLGIPLNALRIRAHRIRVALRDCVSDCLARHAG
jgi:DNA-directed RNA polymerase specialized sigma24 family protein